MTRRAARWNGFGTSVFTEMTERARRHGAVNLAQGFPDFPGPPELLRAVEAHVRTSHHQYAPSSGEERLRRAVAGDHDPSTEVTITSGATEALYAAINAFVNPGDRVVVFEPSYDSYAQGIANAGGVLVPVRLHAPDWSIDWGELEAAAAGGFRLLLLNTPHNPTGKVFTAAELTRIAAVVRDADAIAVCDEVYEHLVYDDAAHVSLQTCTDVRERVVRISSAAKTFGFTGFKVGWVTAPPDLTAAVRLVHQAMVFATPPFLQTAIAEILEDRAWLAGYLRDLRRAYTARRDLLRGALIAAGFRVPQVQGAYFLMADFTELAPGVSDVAFAHQLVDTRGVAAIPPSAFYTRVPAPLPWLRFAFCKRDETLADAAARLAR